MGERQVRTASRRQGPASDQQGWLHEVCAGSGLVLRPPKARVRSPALQAHIASLQKRLEQRQYDAMVHDVTHAVWPPHFLIATAGELIWQCRLQGTTRYIVA